MGTPYESPKSWREGLGGGGGCVPDRVASWLVGPSDYEEIMACVRSTDTSGSKNNRALLPAAGLITASDGNSAA